MAEGQPPTSPAGRILEAHATLARVAGTEDGPRKAYLPGDRAVLTIAVTHDGGRVDWPSREALEQALGGKLVTLEDGRDVPPPAPVVPGEVAARSWSVQLFAAPGAHDIGPFPVRLVGPSGEDLDRVEAPPVKVEVGSVLPPKVARELSEQQDPAALREAAAKALAPVRGPWSLPSPVPWLGLVLALLGALLLALVAWLLWKRLRRKPAVAPVPREAPEVVARRRLAALRARGDLDAGRHLAYHVELADILKEYLSERLGENFLDMTTHEVRQALAGPLVHAHGVSRARLDVVAVLADCDLVKFAKHVPRREDALALAGRVERVVDLTVPPPLPTSSDAAGTPEDGMRGAA